MLCVTILVAGCGARSSIGDGVRELDASGSQDGASDDDVPIVDSAAADARADAVDGGLPFPIPSVSRLFVATNIGIVVYDHPESVGPGTTPSTVLNNVSVVQGPAHSGGRPAFSLAVLGTRLFVGFSAVHTPVLAIFDNADTASGSVAPSAQIVSTDVAGDFFWELQSDRTTNTLWAQSPWIYGSGTSLFHSASLMTSNTKPSAAFSGAPGAQSMRSSFDPATDRLIQPIYLAGTGLRVWNGASERVGKVPPTFLLHAGSYEYVAVGNDRLYATTTDATTIHVWSGFSAITSTTPPTLSIASGTSGLVRSLSIKNDVLVATYTTSNSGLVALYTNASQLVGNSAPTTTMVTMDGSARRALLGKGDRLYVIDAAAPSSGPSAVTIFDHATTAPTFVTSLPFDSYGVNDIALME
ncbi:hypothetical protein BH09MYX1_BH09MYX1_30740 [soil metagenome]